MNALVFVVLAGLEVLSAAASCPRDFSPHCQCGPVDYLGRQQYVVNCTNTGFTDAALLQRLPPMTQVLIFTGNSIAELPLNLFGTLNNYSELRVVDMSNNGIRDVRGKTYHRVSNVERLILNHNRIVISAGEPNHHHPRVFSNFESLVELHLTDAFDHSSPDNLAADLHDIFVNSNLGRLRKLHLEQNGITRFRDPRVFCDLPSLLDLHLGDNGLEGLHFELLCLASLRFLDLERNAIVTLRREELATLDSLATRTNRTLVVDLGGNPLSCAGCELYDWLQKTQVIVRNRDKLRCRHDADRINGALVMELHRPYCPSGRVLFAMTEPGASVPGDSALVVALCLALFASLAALLYTNREPIGRRIVPIVHSVNKKVHYTTIGRQEDHEMDV